MQTAYSLVGQRPQREDTPRELAERLFRRLGAQQARAYLEAALVALNSFAAGEKPSSQSASGGRPGGTGKAKRGARAGAAGGDKIPSAGKTAEPSGES